MGIEIEKKFLVGELPFKLEKFRHKAIEQSYISTSPTIRLRKSNDEYFLTVKGPGQMMHEEFEMAISEEQYVRLITKAEGSTVFKTRYLIPLDDKLVAELDIYAAQLSGLKTVEVEFQSLDQLKAFVPPSWFGNDISMDGRYSNSSLSLSGIPEL